MGEAKRKFLLENIFACADIDDSGKLTATELKKYFESQDMNYYDSFLNEIDENQDGGIDENEFVAGVIKMQDSQMVTLDESIANLNETLESGLWFTEQERAKAAQESGTLPSKASRAPWETSSKPAAPPVVIEEKTQELEPQQPDDDAQDDGDNQVSIPADKAVSPVSPADNLSINLDNLEE